MGALNRQVGIIGAGLMGCGLAQLFARSGWTVIVHDAYPAALEQLPARLAKLRAADELARHMPDRQPGAVRGTSQLAEAVAGAALVIEAAPEKPELKQALFVELAAASAPETVLATNSSVIPVGVVSAKVADAEAGRIVGTHFWNPPELIPLVEVIQGPRSDAAAIARTMEILCDVGKRPVHVRRDVVPANRLQHALWREAMALVDEGVCTPADVDALIKNSFALRLAVLGPLENADLVGLELTADIHRVVLPMLSRATEPARGLTERIASGRKGIASGSGFYDWDEQRIAATRQRLNAHILRRLTEKSD